MPLQMVPCGETVTRKTQHGPHLPSSGALHHSHQIGVSEVPEKGALGYLTVSDVALDRPGNMNSYSQRP